MRWSIVLDVLFPPTCVACGAESTALCERCFPVTAPVRFAVDDLCGIALGRYDGVLRRAVLALKSGRRDVAEALAIRLASHAAVFGAIDVLVPVPTAAARRRSRGFDQAELMARVAGERCGLEWSAALRQTAGDAQHGRSRTERLSTSGRFTRTASSLRSGARVLLLDDVATTGASLRDCAAALRAVGAHVAGVLVVARAER